MIAKISLAVSALIISAQSGDAIRCEPFDASYTLAAQEYEPRVDPYLECLADAEERFGNNNGPFAVSQCAETKMEILATYPVNRQGSISFFIEQIDREHVWLTWCESEAGKPLPIDVHIRSDWPQSQIQQESNAKNQ